MNKNINNKLLFQFPKSYTTPKINAVCLSPHFMFWAKEFSFLYYLMKIVILLKIDFIEEDLFLLLIIIFLFSQEVPKVKERMAVLYPFLVAMTWTTAAVEKMWVPPNRVPKMPKPENNIDALIVRIVLIRKSVSIGIWECTVLRPLAR